MTRHPSEIFIRFLMTAPHPQADDNQWVSSIVTSFGFPPPDPVLLQWIRSDIQSKKPANFQPTDRYHRESVRFMRSEGIYALHNPDKPSREAGLIVTNLKARPIVEGLILGRMDSKEVAKKVNARLGEHLTADGIDAYRHYYWDPSKLKIEDWERLFEQFDTQRRHITAIVQVGPSMALFKMGFQQALDSKTMLREIQEALFFDMKEWKTKPLSPDRTKALTAIARSAAQLDAQLSQADNQLKESLKAFEQFRMQHAQTQVPSLREVAPSGNFTGSGAKLLEASPAQEDRVDES